MVIAAAVAAAAVEGGNFLFKKFPLTFSKVTRKIVFKQHFFLFSFERQPTHAHTYICTLIEKLKLMRVLNKSIRMIASNKPTNTCILPNIYVHLNVNVSCRRLWTLDWMTTLNVEVEKWKSMEFSCLTCAWFFRHNCCCCCCCCYYCYNHLPCCT